jgi:hypothetical protein
MLPVPRLHLANPYGPRISSVEALDADDRRTDPVDDCSEGSRIGVEGRLVLWVADRVAIRAGYIKHGGTLEIEYAPPRRKVTASVRPTASSLSSKEPTWNLAV